MIKAAPMKSPTIIRAHDISPLTMPHNLPGTTFFHISIPEFAPQFAWHLFFFYTTEETGIVGGKILDLVEAARKDDLENFFIIIKSLFAAIPSHIFIKDREAYYHTIIYLILKLLGVNIKVENHTSKGRIDAVIETKTNIYVMEFKMGTSDEALGQIERMKYHEKYLSSGKSIQLIGVGFGEVEKKYFRL
jgi:hypothetical protein